MIALIVIVGLIVFTLLIPSKYDPAIRLKEWLERHDTHND